MVKPARGAKTAAPKPAKVAAPKSAQPPVKASAPKPAKPAKSAAAKPVQAPESVRSTAAGAPDDELVRLRERVAELEALASERAESARIEASLLKIAETATPFAI